MGLFSKLKNVLFEEEEVEIPVITKKTEEEPKELREQRYNKASFETKEIEVTPTRDNISRFRNVKRDIEVDIPSEDIKTQEIPLSLENQEETKSPFLSFDEDEFERVNSRIKENEEKQIKQEKQEKQEKEKQIPKKKEEPRRIEAPKRFKPSPVISPVYGILDKNYKKEDIVEKGTDIVTTYEEVSIETVRKKAFGTLVDDIESTLGEEINIVKDEKQDERSIDEILTASIDETISLDEEIEIPIMNSENASVEDLLEEDNIEEDSDDSIVVEENDEIDEEQNLNTKEIELPTFEDLKDEIEEEQEEREEDFLLEKTDTIKILDDIEDELDEVKANKELLEDTTETDLFNLIDSMYENREEDK